MALDGERHEAALLVPHGLVGVVSVPLDVVFVGELAQAKRGLPSLERAHEAHEAAQAGVLDRVLRDVPVHPVHVVIVTVRVVVTPLGVTVLVAHVNHRDALRDEERGEKVAHLAVSEHLGDGGGVDAVLVGAEAAVPALVVLVAVLVVLAVRVVVLVVVRHQVTEGETVVAGDEVDGVVRLAATLRVEGG